MTAVVRTTGWPSVPKVLVTAIGDRYDCYAATRFPGPDDPDGDIGTILEAGHGVVRIVRIGGTRDRVTDQARVSIDVVHANEAQAEDLAELIAEWLGDDPAVSDGEAMLDRISVEVAPHAVPYPHPTISQFQSVVVASSRRMDD